MALLGNYTVLHKSPGLFTSGAAEAQVRSRQNKPGMSRNSMNTLAFANFNSVPNGYRPGYSWIPAQKDGGLATYKFINSNGDLTNGNLAGGKNASSTLSGIGIITQANLALIVSGVATLLGVGGFATAPIIAGILSAGATLNGSGYFANNPTLGAVLDAIATLLGQGNIVTAQEIAKGALSANIVPYTILSPQNLARAVWDEQITDHLIAGSTGDTLYNAGGGSSPTLIAQAVMASVIETGIDMTQALRLLTAIAAGKTTIVDLGGGQATVSFRNITDTKTRVDADMTNSERTTVTLDLT